MPKSHSPFAINKSQTGGKENKHLKATLKKSLDFQHRSFRLTATEMHTGPFSWSSGNSHARPESGEREMGALRAPFGTRRRDRVT